MRLPEARMVGGVVGAAPMDVARAGGRPPPTIAPGTASARRSAAGQDRDDAGVVDRSAWPLTESAAASRI
ncbi:hypothetical protein ABZ922_05895 [Streptomyces shenzhenensis]|uniref:hypothetical protein n=1 Tax=Streptomyces shenzhenensis TaxID=943815 RepID=UPI0033DA7F72